MAQNHGSSDVHGAATQAPPPYSGMEARRVKALSDEQIADLEAGRGMGMALAAELNLHPGPSHVLELAEALGLTDDQRSRTKELLFRMKAETIPIGKRVVREETELDRLFAEKKIKLKSLAEAIGRIADVQGALRLAHLRYHLEMAESLTHEQINRYSELRGYTGQADQARQRHPL
ncbi:hypothetical protein DUT91_23525 [Phyllobacterium salinisoli]|uniref:Periplasmic heavy metal sensor n=1 Tax=Phyllobacterium salinisoli TaxID=1899321 RepID=A0A368JZA1_9HYPH|nr:hypothetical protein DUT91_23525 [Phyllobacterium salinisoli]